MSTQLENKKIAILLTDGFEEVELTEPLKALQDASAATHIIAPGSDSIRAWDHTDWSKDYDADIKLEDADPNNYDGLFLPGGVMNPDKLRMNQKAIDFTKHFMQTGKPIAAICHGPWLLVETQELDGRRMTSYPSLRTDLINAGANWVDEEVVTDRGLTTSRSPDDIPAFNRKMVEEFAEGVHEEVAHSH